MGWGPGSSTVSVAHPGHAPGESEVTVAESCPTLCDPMDYTVRGILQARTLQWVAFPSPGDLPKPGIEPSSPALQADSLPAELPGKPKNPGVGSVLLYSRSSRPRNRAGPLALQADSLPTEL